MFTDVVKEKSFCSKSSSGYFGRRIFVVANQGGGWITISKKQNSSFI